METGYGRHGFPVTQCSCCTRQQGLVFQALFGRRPARHRCRPRSCFLQRYVQGQVLITAISHDCPTPHEQKARG